MRTDEELALGMKRGNTDDLSLLVERHHSPLVGFLYRMTGGDRGLAEDLVQETFLRVIRAIEQYRYPRSFKAWLYAIATNQARDYFKRADVRRTVSSLDDDPGLFGVYDPRPEDGLIIDDEVCEVVAALQTLPQHQREVIVLRYYQELPLAEIAEALEIPVGTVKSRLSLGLKRLRVALGQKHHGG